MRSIRMWWLVVLFSVVVSAATAEDAQLEVKIVDVDGKPVPRAVMKVTLIGSSGRVVSERESLAGVDGRAFSPLAAGWRFIVSSSLDGWIPTSVGPVQPAGPAGGILPALQICLNKLPKEDFPEPLESRQ